MPWTHFINDLNGEELLEHFTKKNCEKTNRKELEIEKIIKKKGINYMLNGWIDKKDIVQMNKYFPKPKSLEANVKIELDLSNYAKFNGCCYIGFC